MNRPSMNTKLAVAIAALGLVASCSARPDRFVEDETTEITENKVTDVETAREEPVEPLKPVELIDGEAPIKVLGSIGTTQAFQVGELMVIHKATPTNSVVSGRLYLIGGSSNLNSTTAGIEKLALSVATNGGTESTPKDQFNGQLDAMGASVWSFADRDFSGYGLKTIVENFDETWKLFEEAITEPAMPRPEIELRRTKQLAEISSMLENPDRHVGYVATREFFENHPYYHLQIGTRENVESFTRDELGAHQRSLLEPSQMLLVVVGNVSAADVTKKVAATLGRIKTEKAEVEKLPPFQGGPGVRIADRDLPTNYVLGYFPAPSPGATDYPAMVVATEYLRDKLFEEVRTRRNLTYAVSAGLGTQRENYGYLYVTAADPETTMGVIFNTIEEMKLIQIPKAELDEVVNVYLTQHYMGLETNGGQAGMLAEAQIVSGDWRMAEAFLAEVRSVTPEDVQIAARKYFNDYRFGVVGNKRTLQEAFFRP